MTTQGYYCSSDDVAAIMGIPAFSATTSPTDTAVLNMIRMQEGYIEGVTKTAWGHTVPNTIDQDHETYRVGKLGAGWFGQFWYAVYLRNRKIVDPLNPATGDLFEVFNGSNWEDWLTTKIEGVGNDYWIDAANGIVYMRGLWLFLPLNGWVVRFKYHYGWTNVPGDMKMACAYLVAAMVARSAEFYFAMPEGGNQIITLKDKVGDWETKAAQILDRYSAFVESPG